MNLKRVIERGKQRLLVRAAFKFLDDRSFNWATLIAWGGLLAMFPILLVMASLLGVALGALHAPTSDLHKQIAAAFPGDEALQNVILAALDNFKQRSGVYAVVGFVGLLFGGSALFGAMEQGFSMVYQTRLRSFVRQKVMGFVMILVFTVLGGLAIVSSSLLAEVTRLPVMPAFMHSATTDWLLQVLTGAASGFLLYAAIYLVVPNRRQQWSMVWPGALVAGLLFELITLLFPLYISLNKGIANYGQVFALFFTLMTFFYLMGVVTMFGVELNTAMFPGALEDAQSEGGPAAREWTPVAGGSGGADGGL